MLHQCKCKMGLGRWVLFPRATPVQTHWGRWRGARGVTGFTLLSAALQQTAAGLGAGVCEGKTLCSHGEDVAARGQDPKDPCKAKRQCPAPTARSSPWGLRGDETPSRMLAGPHKALTFSGAMLGHFQLYR